LRKTLVASMQRPTSVTLGGAAGTAARAAASLEGESAVRPKTLDGIFRLGDLWLGLDGYALARFCLCSPWAYWSSVAVYDFLPLVVALAWIISRSPTLVRGAIAGALAALPIYLHSRLRAPSMPFTDGRFPARNLLPT
jgi:hypothetical protein